MSDEEIDQYLNGLYQQIAHSLANIQRILPDGYLITLICRNAITPGADIILTKDRNVEAAADALLSKKLKIVESGDSEP